MFQPSRAVLSGRVTAPTLANYRYTLPLTTRWRDNDAYCHLNNVVYLEYFDSIVNHWLIHEAGLTLPPTTSSPSTPPSSQIGLIVHSSTSYFSSLAYPSPILGALAVESLGNSSITWSVALFEAEYVTASEENWRTVDGGETALRVRVKEGQKAAAAGLFKHVFVGRDSRKSEKLEQRLRERAEKLLVK